MASLVRDAKGNCLAAFRWAGKQYTRSLNTADPQVAAAGIARIEETIMRLRRGWLMMPPDADPGIFIVSGGQLATKPVAPVVESTPVHNTPTALGCLFKTYAATLTPGSKESNSLATEAIRRRHFLRLLGEGTDLATLSVERIQRYVDARAREGVERETIRKELATLRVVWGWSHNRGYVAATLAWKMGDLTFPKSGERPPFQTWDQTARRIERGGLSAEEQAELWECLWLDQAQTTECLAWVLEQAPYPFAYPMFAFAAYTGARRGEMLRSEREDWDLAAGTVAIRQKKADRSKTFTRRTVPLHPGLAAIMDNWFRSHPGRPWTICTADGAPIGPRMATKYFRATVAGGKWAVLHGWHIFRHSLASNMASAGVDQRIINEILGHHTEEMERRYRHLLPSNQAHALHALFPAATVR